eukprot:scaffold3443_cov404-Prasinococcus_capsulatus_cf.AAC.8
MAAALAAANPVSSPSTVSSKSSLCKELSTVDWMPWCRSRLFLAAVKDSPVIYVHSMRYLKCLVIAYIHTDSLEKVFNLSPPVHC